jgi:hypothetical protein
MRTEEEEEKDDDTYQYQLRCHILIFYPLRKREMKRERGEQRGGRKGGTSRRGDGIYASLLDGTCLECENQLQLAFLF